MLPDVTCFERPVYLFPQPCRKNANSSTSKEGELEQKEYHHRHRVMAIMGNAEMATIAGTAAIHALHKTAMKSKEEQFRKLVGEYQEMVINTCYRFVFNREDAEDLAQEVFVEVYRSLEQFRAESKLSTWIYRIAVTKSLDHLRRMKRIKRFGSLKRIIGINDPASEIAAPPGDTPQETMEENERARILQNALDTLPDNQRAAFLLSKQDGYSNH